MKCIYCGNMLKPYDAYCPACLKKVEVKNAEVVQEKMKDEQIEEVEEQKENPLWTILKYFILAGIILYLIIFIIFIFFFKPSCEGVIEVISHLD